MQNSKLYLVGGSVRDHILNVPSKDKDYMMETSFEGLKNFVEDKGYIILHEKPDFLTLKVKIPTSEVVDFVCCRTEGDYDGRRPGTVTATTLENDLSRRDFTVNAMAWEVDPITFEPIGDIVDLFNGKQDLAESELRFVGDPLKRLEEDGLRWLRGLRFWITRGFYPVGGTKSALLNPPADVLKKVSSDRIRDELNKCFKHDVRDTIRILNMIPPYWMKDDLWLKATLEEK